MVRKIKDPHEATLAFQRGEESGFDFFYKEYWGALLFHAKGFMINEPDYEELCKDMVEDVFIRMWERHKQFAHHKVIRDWLYTSVRNECMGYFQVNPRHKRSEKEYAYLFDFPSKPLDNSLIRAEVIKELYICLDACLPDKRKSVIIMRYIQEKSVKEISKELGLKISTVKNHISNGIHSLRKKYEVDETEVENKYIRLLKRICLTSDRKVGVDKMYGFSKTHIFAIKNGEVLPHITKNFE